MSGLVTKIMVEVLSILSLMTKHIRQARLGRLLYIIICLVSDVFLEMFARKLLGESEIQDVLHRLDRLTLDEARITGTETLQVIHGLVRNLRLIINGTLLSLHGVLIAHKAVRIDGTISMHDIWQALGMLCI